jgi:membrane protease YdiL (CAAX protease family)
MSFGTVIFDTRFWIANLSEWLGVVAVIMILATSKRFIRRPVVFKYRRREMITLLSLYAFILLAAWAVYGGLLPFVIGSNLPEQLGARLALALAALAAAAAALYVRRQPLLSVAWGRPLLKPALQVGFALAIMSVFLRQRIYMIIDGVSQTEALALLALIAIVVAEETVFRGFIQLRLADRWGDLAGWLVTAALYILWILPRWLLLGQPWQTLVAAAVMAVLMGYIMRKSGHNAAGVLFRTISEWVVLLA